MVMISVIVTDISIVNVIVIVKITKTENKTTREENKLANLQATLV